MKKWYHSKTLWVNFAGGIIIGGVQVLSEQAPEIMPWLGGILALGNFLLRFKTTQSLSS
jgi:hypothetical protein